MWFFHKIILHLGSDYELMDPGIVLFIILAYFGVLIFIGYLTTRKGKGNSETFFTANRNSPWYLVAFGMIGTSLSGVTFISVPGEVGSTGWTYLTLVMGNCIGYIIIGLFLLPLFYKLNLVSIYTWLGNRFGEKARLTGSAFFILSQLIGASFRLFLVVGVLQLAFFDSVGIPFWVTVFITIAFVWIYTARGGIKTIVWTDTLQTVFMLASLVITIAVIMHALDFNFSTVIWEIRESPFSRTFDFDWRSGQNTIKQLFAGAAITIAINGLDQNIMQKNLTCRSVRDCKINMLSFSGLFLITNIIFLSLGALLYIYAGRNGITLPTKTDDVFPFLALNHFGTATGLFFLLGVIAAAYSSVDSSLTALTTSFCIDFLKVDPGDSRQKKRRIGVHLTFSLLMIFVVILFRELNNGSVVSAVFTAVGYTYGPILGLFTFGLLTKRKVRDRSIPWIAIASPILSYIINLYSEQLLGGYKFGFEILLLNGLFTFTGLLIFSQRKGE